MAYTNKIYIIWMVTICLVIAAVDATGILFLGPRFFAFRAWEAMVNKGEGGPFKSNTVFEAEIHGDLSNMLKINRFCQYRHQRFSTDSYGYRNPDLKMDIYYPVIAVGDSAMAGASLSDKDIFSVQLSKMLDVPVYNYSTALPIEFLADRRFKDSPPGILIWEAHERMITGDTYRIFASIPVNAEIMLPEKTGGPNSGQNIPRLSEYYARWIVHDLLWRATGIHNGAVGYIDEGTGMLFFKPDLDMLKLGPSERGLEDIVKGIQRIKEICEKRGIVLVYVPLPSKESVYCSLLPDHMKSQLHKESTFLVDLHTALDERDIYNVNLYKAFHAQGKNLLYFPDDTHWNAHGVSVGVRETGRLVKNLEAGIVSKDQNL